MAPETAHHPAPAPPSATAARRVAQPLFHPVTLSRHLLARRQLLLVFPQLPPVDPTAAAPLPATLMRTRTLMLVLAKVSPEVRPLAPAATQCPHLDSTECHPRSPVHQDLLTATPAFLSAAPCPPAQLTRTVAVAHLTGTASCLVARNHRHPLRPRPRLRPRLKPRLLPKPKLPLTPTETRTRTPTRTHTQTGTETETQTLTLTPKHLHLRPDKAKDRC